MKSKEVKYFKSLLCVTIALVILFLISMIYSVSEIFENKNMNSVFFELIYSAFHLIVLGLVIILNIQAIQQKDSFIIKGLMTEGNGKAVNKVGQIISLVLASISFLITIYFSLVFFKVPLPYFNFPEILILLLINVSLLVSVYGVYFYIYPFIKIDKDNRR